MLEASGIWKSFAGVQALRNASFELNAGEVHALVGENGAGKSTLIKIISGALQPDSGTLSVGGQLVSHNTPGLARSLGIAVIYQQPALFPHLSVAENIGIALETGRPWRKVDWRGRERQARELLERAGADIDPRRLVSSLSMPEQQMVEIAKAIGASARIFIMDEPTASLTDREVDKLFEVIRTLRSQGAGVVYISHRLEEISTIADRVTVLRDGEAVATRSMQGIDRAELIRMMVGRPLSAVFPKREIPIGDVVLEICPARGLPLTVRSGEIVGLAGLVGSGRTELAEALFGLRRAHGSVVLVRNREVSLKSPAHAIELGIAYVPEDRRQHGVIMQMPLAANTTLATLRSISRHGLLVEGRERELAVSYIERLRIKTSGVYAETGSLSGGNQQKVALARWLATRPSVLIFDEPTQGVDVASKAEIHRLMVELAAQGLAILMISSELSEILGMSDRVAVMHEGAVAGVLGRAEATPQKILSLALGHS